MDSSHQDVNKTLSLLREGSFGAAMDLKNADYTLSSKP
ncbi:MAG: hypothetical protein ACI8X5_003966 [Planctomycetota bacterium]|jgi:hypothetical protein